MDRHFQTLLVLSCMNDTCLCKYCAAVSSHLDFKRWMIIAKYNSITKNSQALLILSCSTQDWHCNALFPFSINSHVSSNTIYLKQLPYSKPEVPKQLISESILPTPRLMLPTPPPHNCLISNTVWYFACDSMLELNCIAKSSMHRQPLEISHREAKLSPLW